MYPPQRLRALHPKGFTIIEIMIVLAIAGAILLIIFLAVPALRRNARNYDRKNYSSIVNAELLNYFNDTGHMPGALGNPHSAASQAEICTFLQSLPQVKAGTPCGYSNASNTSVNGTIAEDCATIQAGQYTVCYQSWDSVAHGYIGPDDEISIMLAHWCNAGSNIDPSEPATYPVAGNDSNTKRYAVWTTLEGVSQPLCFDGSPNTS